MEITLFWFRRDLRLNDNHGLYRALKESKNVLPIFIFDSNILEELKKSDRRVSFIYREVLKLKTELNKVGSDLEIYHGKPIDVWKKILNKKEVKSVYLNHDYEPYAIDRDTKVKMLLDNHRVPYFSHKDHVIFERREILTAAGGVYTVFTPYKRKWLERFKDDYLDKLKTGTSYYPSEKYTGHFYKTEASSTLSLSDMGFIQTSTPFPERTVNRSLIQNYAKNRDYPGLEKSTSRLGVHFRFGTISIREKAIAASNLSDVYLSELIWRDFYAQILYNFPQVMDNSFRPKYDRIHWRNNQKEFEKWCEGMTGYPMVDAGMRELNATGYMHNRVRMVTASFLTKHLLVDWRWGEAYFAEKLLDFDLASNNGGWQWAAGSGTDAAPYFRIFNPTSQLKKFDKDSIYIHKWIPELDTPDYPKPIVDHKLARERCLRVYKAALSNE